MEKYKADMVMTATEVIKRNKDHRKEFTAAMQAQSDLLCADLIKWYDKKIKHLMKG